MLCRAAGPVGEVVEPEDISAEDVGPNETNTVVGAARAALG